MQYVTFVWDAIKAGVPLAFLAAVAYVIYVAVTKGGPAAWTLLKSWFGATKREVISLHNRVDVIEAKLGITKPLGMTGPTGVSGPAQ